jgi:D-sedoheptulose 7-phosphate isomerase
MPLHDRIHGHFLASAQLHLEAADALSPVIEQAAKTIVQCLTQGGKVLVCGNGGSAADAQRFAAAMINRFEQERPGLSAIALTTDTSILTSIANDYAYEQVFARQVKALGLPGDVLLAITTSGNSPSVLEAVTAAHTRGMSVIALTGQNGGRLAEQIRESDVHLCVPAESSARIQEVHLLTIHCLCDAVDSVLLGVES